MSGKTHILSSGSVDWPGKTFCGLVPSEGSADSDYEFTDPEDVKRDGEIQLCSNGSHRGLNYCAKCWKLAGLT